MANLQIDMSSGKKIVFLSFSFSQKLLIESLIVVGTWDPPHPCFSFV